MVNSVLLLAGIMLIATIPNTSSLVNNKPLLLRSPASMRPLTRPDSPLRSGEFPLHYRGGCAPLHMAVAADGIPVTSSNKKPGSQASAVYGLILLNFGIFVADKVLRIPAMRSLYLYHHRWAWWQPLTSCFCHGSRSHLSGSEAAAMLAAPLLPAAREWRALS